MLIGIDVGTTAVKAALFDERGHSLRQFNQAYPTRRPQIGHVEQDPKDWLDLVLKALKVLGDGVSIKAIGLCSQVNTHVFADKKGKEILPAITWQDTRCARDAAALDEKLTAEEKNTWWGAPLPVDASHVLARIAHIKRTQPDQWTQTRYVFAPKDYCLFHLTGQAVADPMTNFGILDQNLELIDTLFALVPDARERLPKICGFMEQAGTIQNGLPCAGVPVVTGAMDAWSGLLGAGVTQNGQGLYLSGTSEILGIVSSRHIPTPGVIAFAECEGIRFHAGPTQSGGASAQWAANFLNLNLDDFFAKAERAKADYVPLFLPHLDGERAPLWDSEAKGSFTGLKSETSTAEFARAVLDGVAYSSRLVFEALAKSADRMPAIIHYSGGGARSDFWSQIRSNVLGLPLKRTAFYDAGVLGSALMAGVGANIFRSLSDAAKNFVIFDRLFEPDLKASHYHDHRFNTYKLAYERLKDVNRQLS